MTENDETVECPVCGAGPFESADPHLKGHVSGTPDDAHDWTDVKDQLDDPPESTDGTDTDDHPEDPPESPPEGGSDGGSVDPDGDDDPEQAGDDSDSTDESETDDTDSTPSTTTMPDSDPDDQQWTTLDDQPDDDADGQAQPPQKSTKGDSGGIPIPVDTTTLYLGVGVIAVGALVVIWLRMGDDGQQTDVVDGVEESSDDGDGEVGGAGLVATTGGIDDE